PSSVSRRISMTSSCLSFRCHPGWRAACVPCRLPGCPKSSSCPWPLPASSSSPLSPGAGALDRRCGGASGNPPISDAKSTRGRPTLRWLGRRLLHGALPRPMPALVVFLLRDAAIAIGVALRKMLPEPGNALRILLGDVALAASHVIEARTFAVLRGGAHAAAWRRLHRRGAGFRLGGGVRGRRRRLGGRGIRRVLLLVAGVRTAHGGQRQRAGQCEQQRCGLAIHVDGSLWSTSRF